VSTRTAAGAGDAGTPDSAAAWHALGTALVRAGRTGEAARAFEAALEREPAHLPALINLGHALYGLGRADEAIACLVRASALEPGNPEALRGLAEMLRRTGQLQAAIDAAEEQSRLHPQDVLAALDLAEMQLALDRLDDAARTFDRVGRVDLRARHGVYAYHGMIEVEIRRRNWRRALELAIAATRIDRGDLTTRALAFVASRLFGAGPLPVPSEEEILDALAEARAEHRRGHSAQLARAARS